jgi:hypothetical protein
MAGSRDSQEAHRNPRKSAENLENFFRYVPENKNEDFPVPYAGDNDADFSTRF